MPHQRSKDSLFLIAVGISVIFCEIQFIKMRAVIFFFLLKVVHVTSPAWKKFGFSSEEDQDLELKPLYEQYL